jgi:hypothetical protein
MWPFRRKPEQPKGRGGVFVYARGERVALIGGERCSLQVRHPDGGWLLTDWHGNTTWSADYLRARGFDADA